MTNTQTTPAEHYADSRARLEAYKAAPPRYRVVDHARLARRARRLRTFGRGLRACCVLIYVLAFDALCLG